MSKRLKKIINTLVKLVITGVAVYIVLSNINLDNLVKHLQKANWLLVIVALLAFAVAKVAEAFRLNVFFRAIGLKISEFTNTKLFTLGMFYNLFLPGGIGGDSYKVYWLNKKYKASVKSLIWASLLNRANGFLAIVLLLSLMIPFVNFQLDYLNLAPILFPVSLLVYFLVLKFFFKKYVPGVYASTVYSLVCQLFQLLSFHILLLALDAQGANIDYWACFMASNIAFAVPVTIGGIGARELVFVFSARFLTVDADVLIAISLFFYVFRAITSLFGAYFVFNPDKIDTEAGSTKDLGFPDSSP